MKNRIRKQQRADELDVFPTPDRRWKRACQTVLPSILDRDVAFVAARAIYEKNVLQRAELESRLLAEESDATIALRMGIPIEVVDEFAYWFYDLIGRLGMTGWIMHEAVRRRPAGALASDDWAILWKSIGYSYGPLVLEELLKAVDPETLQNKGIDAYLERGVPLDPEFKVLILIERMAVPETPEEWNRLHRCRRAMSIKAVPRTGELLSSFNSQFLAFSEPEVTVEATEYEEIEGVDLLCELINRFVGKPARVVQSQAA